MYYNQNDYPNTPYPAPGYESATVKSGGCGVCVMAMLIEDLLGITFPPPKMAEYAIKCKARVSGGTNMETLCRAIAKEYGLKYSTTSQAADALAALGRGAKVIANVGGDRSGYTGLFSNGGHYIYLRSADGTQVTVWDSGDKTSPTDKFKINGRAARVTVKRPDIITAMVEIDKDCANRSPRYYILESEATKVDNNTPSAWAKNSWEKAVRLGITDGTNPKDPATREQLIVILDRLGLMEVRDGN